MRKLTIKRRKSFYACLVSSKVYLETPNGGDTVINGTVCTKIGELKNGEEKTFNISDNAVKVYVVCNSLELYNDFYQLTEGSEDVTLTGKHAFSMNGAFVFDNNTNPEAIQHRKKGKRLIVIIMIIAVVIGAVAGFASAMWRFFI